MKFTLGMILEARERLKGVAQRTGLVQFKALSDEHSQIYLKTEDLQNTGSFKVRGAYIKIASLSEDGQSLCANEDVPQYSLPLNLFIGDKREVPLVDVVVWAKKRIFPKNRMDCKEILKMMGLPDYNAWEIVKRTNACLMEDPYWLRFSEDETFEDTTRGRARRIMNENQKSS